MIKIIFLLTIFYTNIQFAKEILIYADSITYDSEKNIIAKGNVKIIKENEIITSDLIIYNNAQIMFNNYKIIFSSIFFAPNLTITFICLKV